MCDDSILGCDTDFVADQWFAAAPAVCPPGVANGRDVATRVAVPKDALAEMPEKKQRCQQRLVAATVATPKIEEEVKDSAGVKLAPPTDHAETDRAAIVAEVEARVVEALLEQQIAVEVVNEAIRHHEDSQQIQCAI